MRAMRRVRGVWRKCQVYPLGKEGDNRVRGLYYEPESNQGEFTINLNKTGMPQEYRDTEYDVWVDDMKHFLELIVTGWRFKTGPIRLNIDFGFAYLDSNELAHAGPGNGDINPMDFLSDLELDGTNKVARPIHGTLVFNTKYFEPNPTTTTQINWKKSFFHICLHECLHVVGIGALWNGSHRIISYVPVIGAVILPTVFPYNVFVQGNPATAEYIGPMALQKYKETIVGKENATAVPVENYQMTSSTLLMDMGGTAGSHWRENPGGAGLTGVLDKKGRDWANEVMTGWSNSQQDEDTWVSEVTIGALYDMGYKVDYLPINIDLHKYKSVNL